MAEDPKQKSAEEPKAAAAPEDVTGDVPATVRVDHKGHATWKGKDYDLGLSLAGMEWSGPK